MEKEQVKIDHRFEEGDYLSFKDLGPFYTLKLSTKKYNCDDFSINQRVSIKNHHFYFTFLILSYGRENVGTTEDYIWINLEVEPPLIKIPIEATKDLKPNKNGDIWPIVEFPKEIVFPRVLHIDKKRSVLFEEEKESETCAKNKQENKKEGAQMATFIPEIEQDDRILSVRKITDYVVTMRVKGSWMKEKGVAVGDRIALCKQYDPFRNFYVVRTLNRIEAVGYDLYELSLDMVEHLEMVSNTMSSHNKKKTSPKRKGIDLAEERDSRLEEMSHTKIEKLGHLNNLLDRLDNLMRNRFPDLDDLYKERSAFSKEQRIIFTAIEYLERFASNKLTVSDCATKHSRKVTPRKIGKRDTRKVMIENDEDYWHNF